MGSQIQIYLFGDQTFDATVKLRDLCRSNAPPILESFLGKAYYQIRTEIGQLSARERESYPRFSSLHDILSWERTHIANYPALQSALTCIYQLGEFIRSADSWIKR